MARGARPTQTMTYVDTSGPSKQRTQGILAVILVHAVILYALATGLARKAVDALQKPLEVVLVKDNRPLPPPPPPVQPQEIKLPDVLVPPVIQPPLVVETPSPLPPPPVVTPKAAEPPPPRPDTAAPRTPSTAPATNAAPAESEAQKVASLEGEYAGKLRAMLNSTKRYPTGRQASQQRPQGKVKLWFTVARGGALIDAGILESSNSNLLDDAALGAVRRGTYPPFPPNTWTGQEQHKFTAELEFTPPSS